MTAKNPPEVLHDGNGLVRISEPEFSLMLATLFARYPRFEWATFARFGWRQTPLGLVLTLAALDLPTEGDLDDTVGHVIIREPYSLRVALAAELHSLGVGVIHSHPEDYETFPSTIDDDMDGYYARYFSDFAPNRPYVSLIFARSHDGVLSGSGRVFLSGEWKRVEGFAVERRAIRVVELHSRKRNREVSALNLKTVERLASAFGLEAAERLARSTVAVVGASGTGSPALEILARAGVGRLIAVDPDVFAESNLERVHGSMHTDIPTDSATVLPKVEIALRHLKSINPKMDVTAVNGRVPQPAVIDLLARVDVVLGCTDKHHSRLALSDLATRYLVPVIDCGVSLEGEDGRISGQVVQIARLLPSDPCALCRGMISANRVTQELMTSEEREQRQHAAALARERGDDPGGYWHDEPQLNTVGYLTTLAGALAAGYAIGWITGRFDPPFGHMQMNLSAPFFDWTDALPPARPECSCRRVKGWADQGEADALVTSPSHWPPAVFSKG
jgi:molybdopterin/thiamine biosynthesis adenylyltransferase